MVGEQALLLIFLPIHDESRLARLESAADVESLTRGLLHRVEVATVGLLIVLCCKANEETVTQLASELCPRQGGRGLAGVGSEE